MGQIIDYAKKAPKSFDVRKSVKFGLKLEFSMPFIFKQGKGHAAIVWSIFDHIRDQAIFIISRGWRKTKFKTGKVSAPLHLR